MKNILAALTLIVFVCTGSVFAQGRKHQPNNTYVIEKVKKQGVRWAFVDRAWKRDALCIRADIYVTHALKEDTKFYAKAYFYNKDKKIMHVYAKPALAKKGQGEDYTTLPGYLVPNQKYEIYFPITEKIKSKTYKWENSLVVFGDENKAVAKLYKTGGFGKIKDYDFYEKNLIKE